MEDTKKCSKCKRELNLSEFYKSQCIRCYEYNKQYKLDNSDKLKVKQKHTV